MSHVRTAAARMSAMGAAMAMPVPRNRLRLGSISSVPVTNRRIPESTQTSLRQRLLARADDRWPQIDQLHTRYRAGYAYIDATLDDGDQLKLFRLSYAGSASRWGFAIPRQPRRLPASRPPRRLAIRHPRRRPRHRRRPLPR